MGRLLQAVRGYVQSFTGDPAPTAGLDVNAAHARGMQLLAEHLSPVQRAQYAQFNYFDVVGGNTGRRYRIRQGKVANVEVFDQTGQCMCLLCFAPRGNLPVGDVMLAQKLALESFEVEAIKLAHIAPILPERLPRGLLCQLRLRR